MNKDFKKGVLTGAGLCIVLFLLIFGGRTIYSNKMKTDDSLVQKVTNKVEVLQAYIDKYYYKKDINEDKLADGIYKGVVEALDDPYSVYYTPTEYKEMMETYNGTYCGIGASVSKDAETGVITIVQPFEGGPASKVGVQPGDILYKVEGEEVTKQDLTAVVAKMKGEKGTKVNIEVMRNGSTDPIPFTITRDNVDIVSISHEMLENNIGYVKITEFDENTPDQFTKAVEDLKSKGMKGLVIDLRNNGGGSLDAVTKMLDYMLPEGTILTTKSGTGEVQTFSSDNTQKFDEPLAVLINGSSASASEVFSGAIQDFKAGSLVGTTSFGKGIVQTILPLSNINDGSAVKLTTQEYFLPSGRSIHKVGLTPDVEAKLPKELQSKITIEKAQDTQLQAAIQNVESKLK